MKYVAGLHENSEKSGFGISFPDFPGCISFGESREEAIRNGEEALAFHIEGMVGDGEDVPPPRGRSEVVADPELASWIEDADVVEVDAATPSGPVEPPEDPFLRDIGEIFDRKFARLLEPFLVPDAPAAEGEWGGIRLILLAESPHTEEVNAGRPFAGHSGGAVTRLLRKGLPRSGASRIGILNVCRLPLQAKAYEAKAGEARSLAEHSSWRIFVESLDDIKNAPETRARSSYVKRRMDEVIVKDLRRRLRNVHDPDKAKLACCGKLALTFYAKTQSVYLPHPARGQWERDGNREAVANLFRDTLAAREDIPEFRATS